ncbi:MAG: DUF2254 family protein [Parvibaculum sp.]
MELLAEIALRALSPGINDPNSAPATKESTMQTGHPCRTPRTSSTKRSDQQVGAGRTLTGLGRGVKTAPPAGTWPRRATGSG